MQTPGRSQHGIPNDSKHAFALYELLVVVGILVVLGFLLWASSGVWAKWRTQAKAATCVNNLAKIGAVMKLYTGDNKGKLPYAGIRITNNLHWSWDDLLNQRLGEKWNPSQLASANPVHRLKVLQCPADDLKAINPRYSKAGGHRRSYAMPFHNMAAANWPPGPENKTGLGLFWDLAEKSTFADSIKRWNRAVVTTPLAPPPPQASFTASMVLQPAKTISLTERVHTNNVTGNVFACTIPNPAEHIHYRLPMDPQTYHKGRFNYLFVDGHVESLEPVKTLGGQNPSPAVQSGLWTVNPND